MLIIKFFLLSYYAFYELTNLEIESLIANYDYLSNFEIFIVSDMKTKLQ